MEEVNTVVVTSIYKGYDDIPQLKLAGNPPSGDVTINGDANSINTASGDVDCHEVKGSVHTMSGDVTCGDIAGSVNTMSGDVYRK